LFRTSYSTGLSQKHKTKETILDANTRMVFLIYDKIGKKEVNL